MFPGLSVHLNPELLGGMKLNWVLMQGARKVGSWPLTLLCLSRPGELFLAGKFILAAEQSRPEGWDDGGKMQLFPPSPLVQFLSDVLFPCVADTLQAGS